MMIDKISNCNYIEILLIKKKKNDSVYEINFDDHISSILSNFAKKNKHLKYFKKHLTKLMMSSYELIIDNSDYTTSLVDMKLLHTDRKNDKQYLCNYYNKLTFNTQNFPSTKNIGDIVDVKRLSYKISSNIYLNFDSVQTNDNNIFTHVFININLQKIANTDDMNNTINKLLADLELAPIY